MRPSSMTSAALAGLLAVALLAACGDSDDVRVRAAAKRGKTKTTEQETTTTAAAPATTAAAATGTPTTAATGTPTTAVGGPSPSPPPPPPPLALVGKNVAFVPTRLEAPAGQRLTIAFDNQDTGILHNVHVKGLPGDQEAMTQFEAGPVRQELSLQVEKPGSYEFVCDVHPAQMKGELVVK